MVFHKEIGKLFNRKKLVDIPQKNISSENNVAENALSSNLAGQNIELEYPELRHKLLLRTFLYWKIIRLIHLTLLPN